MGTGVEEALPLVADIFAEDVAAPGIIGAEAGGAAAGAVAAPASYGGAGDYASATEGASVSATETAGIGAGRTAADAFQTIKSAATILSPIASIAASASGISAAKRAASLSTMPRVAPSTPIPSFGSPIVGQAQQASFTEQLRRRGRAATILTSTPDETLGG